MIPVVPNRAPVVYHRCPIHRQLVGFDGDGTLLGQCDGCARDAAQGIDKITHGVAQWNLWALRTLGKVTNL